MMKKPILRGAHEVTLEVVEEKCRRVKTKKLKADPERVAVDFEDKITWKMKHEDGPFLVVIKDPVSPLDWSIQAAPKGKKIVGYVRRDAPARTYQYGIGVFDGTEIIVSDPEIIVKRPLNVVD